MGLFGKKSSDDDFFKYTGDQSEDDFSQLGVGGSGTKGDNNGNSGNYFRTNENSNAYGNDPFRVNENSNGNDPFRVNENSNGNDFFRPKATSGAQNTTNTGVNNDRDFFRTAQDTNRGYSQPQENAPYNDLSQSNGGGYEKNVLGGNINKNVHKNIFGNGKDNGSNKNVFGEKKNQTKGLVIVFAVIMTLSILIGELVANVMFNRNYNNHDNSGYADSNTSQEDIDSTNTDTPQAMDISGWGSFVVPSGWQVDESYVDGDTSVILVTENYYNAIFAYFYESPYSKDEFTDFNEENKKNFELWGDDFELTTQTFLSDSGYDMAIYMLEYDDGSYDVYSAVLGDKKYLWMCAYSNEKFGKEYEAVEDIANSMNFEGSMSDNSSTSLENVAVNHYSFEVPDGWKKAHSIIMKVKSIL